MKIGSKREATMRYVQLQNETGKARVSQPQSSKDSISISPAARLLQECLAAEEPFEQDKVSAIKLALERGDYQTDAKVLADKLVAEIALERGASK